MATHSSTLAWNIPWVEEPGRLQSMGSWRVGHDWVTWLSCIGEGNGNHSSVLAWRIPGTGELGGLPSMGSHRVGHDWSDLAAAAHVSKVILRILQARLQQYVNLELPDVQAGFRKGRGTSNQIANIWWIIEKTGKFQKNICFIDYAKAFDCVDHNKLWKILKEMGISDHLLASWETCMQVKKLQNQAWNNRLIQNGERNMSRLHILTLLFNFYAEYIMRNAGLDEAQVRIKIAQRNTNHLRYADDSTLRAESKESLHLV